MNIKTFQEKSQRTVDRDLTPTALASNLLLGLAGETGEVVDLFKKHLYHGHGLYKPDLIEEMGDVMFYLVNIATLYDVDMEQVMKANYNKLLERYPEGFDKERSINRD